jgi:peptidoglycan/xylan/chitin deacetylase (PgdA/CDA1 family)
MTSFSAITPSTSRQPQLNELLRPVLSVELDARPGGGLPVWLASDSWRLLARVRPPTEQPPGEPIQQFMLENGTTTSAVRSDLNGRVFVPFDPDEAYANYVLERWRAKVKQRALGTRQLQLYYRVKKLLPRTFWLHARRTLMRHTTPPAFPAWPLEDGVDRLLRFAARCLLVAGEKDEASFAWFWPERHRAALILTHDVESEQGLRLALELADLEQERGLHSSFNVVGGDYPVDLGILKELEQRGFEIGLHGLHHDRSLFSSRSEFERQLPALREAADRFGSVGFRSPATHRVLDWLPELPAEYDCTVPHSDPYEPQPGGCCTVWPFSLDGLIELPYTLAQDHTLFTLLGTRSIQPWLDQVGALEARFGLIQCLSHPDPGYLGDADKRALYRDFLDAVADRDTLWKALPRTVADWWRRRAAGETRPPEQRLGSMSRSAHGSATFEPPAD